MTKRHETITGDARQSDAIKLIKADPAKYVASTRRQDFGFVTKKSKKHHH